MSTIPPNIFIPCPQIGFRNRRASKCPECPHFVEILQVREQADRFDQKCRIVCAHPVARRVACIEVEDAGPE